MLVPKRVVALSKVRTLKIPDAQAVAPGLVHVGGANAFERAADFGLSLGGFRGRIEQTVGRKDEMRLATDGQTRGHVHAQRHQRVNLFFENDWVDDHAVAHHVQRVGAEHPARDGVQHVLDAIKFQRVARVGASLETGDHVILGGEYVHDFSFAFVAPLEAEQDVNFHASQRLWQALWLGRLGPLAGVDVQTMVHHLDVK